MSAVRVSQLRLLHRRALALVLFAAAGGRRRAAAAQTAGGRILVVPFENARREPRTCTGSARRPRCCSPTS